MFNPYYSLAQNFSFISPTIYKSRFYKNLIRLTPENIFERKIEPELLWLKTFLHQKAVFLDIGAGNGHYLYYLDYILFPENIYAFEPHKKLHKRLKNLFPKMNTYSLALSNEVKNDTLYIPKIDKEEHYDKATLFPLHPDNEDTQILTQKAEITTLDQWVSHQELTRLDLIKIDTCGQELSILNGAKETLRQYQPTLMIKIEQTYHSQPIWEIIQEIETLGYTAHYLHRDKFELEPLTSDILIHQNTIFAQDDSRRILNIIFLKN